MDLEDCNRLLVHMKAELISAAQLVRACIKESQPSGAELTPHKAVEKERVPLSLKERMARNAVEQGVVRGERSHEQKTIARLEIEVERCKDDTKRLLQETHEAKSQAKQARSEAVERLTTAELWRKKAEDCYREKSIAEQQWKREREDRAEEHAAKHADSDASLAEKETCIRELEDKMLESYKTWQHEKNELHRRQQVLQAQLREAEQSKIECEQSKVVCANQYETTHRAMVCTLDQHATDVQLLKNELHSSSQLCVVQIQSLEQVVRVCVFVFAFVSTCVCVCVCVCACVCVQERNSVHTYPSISLSLSLSL